MRFKVNARKFVLILIILAIMSNLFGCSTQPVKKDTIKVTDQLGRQVIIPKEVNRIVSSYYISTSLLIALGAKDKIVGLEIKAEDRPLYKKAAPELLDLPAIGSGKTLNIEECLKLKPDLVILPTRLKEYVEKLEKLDIPVIAISPEDLDSLSDSFMLIGKAIGAEERAQELVDFYKKKVERVESLVAGVKNRPTVYLAGKRSPLTTCTKEMYQHFLINLAGGRNVSEEIEKGYWANISQEQVLKWNPDRVLIVQYASYTNEDLINDGKWKAVSAVQNKKIDRFPSAIEPWDYPMPSAVLGILWLTNNLHPELYSKSEMEKDIQYFYKKFYGIETTLEEFGI